MGFKKDIKKLCKDFAKEHLGVEVKVVIDEGFSIIIPYSWQGNQKPILFIQPWGTIEEPKEQENAEKELFSFDNSEVSYFTRAFLHELGHYQTNRFLNDSFREKLQLKSNSVSTIKQYKKLPHEVLADVWAFGFFMPQNKESVIDFDNKFFEILEKYDFLDS